MMLGVALLLLVAMLYVAMAKPLSYKPWSEAREVFQKSRCAFINNRGLLTGTWYVFVPEGGQHPGKGFIFYPGGLVDPRAYAPFMQALAQQGYFAVIAAMPLDLAVLGYRRADSIIKAYPDITTWVIGGHSLGGVMACRYARAGNKLSGVVLWASYTSKAFSLAHTDIKVISIYGSQDGLATVAKIENSKKELPKNTLFVEIKGGNHSQFGWYGNNGQLQRGDTPAAISRDRQQQCIIQATVDFLDRVY